MSDVSVVIVGGASGLGAGIGAALGVPFLALEASSLEGDNTHLTSAERLVWCHPVPARAGGSDGKDGVFAEATALLASACAARAIAERSSARLVFIAVLPAQGLIMEERGAACDMASSAMDSLMRAGIGPWSNDGHRLVSVVYTGIAGHVTDGLRAEDDIRKRIPMHELSTFQQFAYAIRFVGSDRAAYITGTSLHVDGAAQAYSWIYPARTI